MVVGYQTISSSLYIHGILTFLHKNICSTNYSLNGSWLKVKYRWDLISVQIVLPKNERHVSKQVCHVMKFEFTGWQKIQNLKDYLHSPPSNQFKIYNMTLQLVTWTCVSICVRFRYKYLFIWHVMKHVLVGYSRRKYSTLKFSKCLTYLYNIWLWQIATLLH